MNPPTKEIEMPTEMRRLTEDISVGVLTLAASTASAALILVAAD